jgi:F420-dependent oxidoreductase-like protein
MAPALSIFVSSLMGPDATVSDLVDIVGDLEQRGFHGAWASEGIGFDPVTALAVAGSVTARIQLGTAVIRTWPRHPIVAAQQAQVANAASGGRFHLGVGPGHAANLEEQFGITLDRPISHLREYLTITRALLQTGSVDHDGQRYRARARLRPGGLGAPVLVAGLSEQVCRLAGRVADGVITWLAPPAHVASTIVPMVHEGARRAGRRPPRIVVGAPATACSDPAAVRAAVREQFPVYARLPFYAALFERAGLGPAAGLLADGWSDAAIDAVFPRGDEAALSARIEEYRAAGADEVVLAPFGAGTVTPADTLDALDSITRL